MSNNYELNVVSNKVSSYLYFSLLKSKNFLILYFLFASLHTVTSLSLGKEDLKVMRMRSFLPSLASHCSAVSWLRSPQLVNVKHCVGRA